MFKPAAPCRFGVGNADSPKVTATWELQAKMRGATPKGEKEKAIYSGQIIATSHDLTPNGGLVREIPLFQGNSRLVKYYNFARYIQITRFSKYM